MRESFKQGHVEVICGPMYSGKSTEMMRRLRRARIGRQKVQVFKPKLDTRGDMEKVSSHDKVEFQAIPVETPRAILGYALDDETQVVGIDEAQFFDESIVSVVQMLADRGIRVIIAGLDTDFQFKPFGAMPALLVLAESVDKLTAVCTVCGEPATRTQRLTESKELVIPGAAGQYEARCRKHHTF